MKSAYDGFEKRRYERVKASFIVVCQVDSQLQKTTMFITGKEIDGLMLDLSEGGMAISVDYDIPVSTRLLINFTLITIGSSEDDRVKHVKAAGEVRNNILLKDKEHRIGVLFTQISEKDRIAIINFVKTTKKR